MKNIHQKQFIDWAKDLNIGPDERYEEPRCLIYIPHREYDRVWEIPETFNELAQFVAHVLDGVDPWSYCRIWPRGGYWPSMEEVNNDKERERLFEAAGIELGAQYAIEYSPEERPSIIALLASQLHYGSNTGDDTFLVPDHGRQLIQADHHNTLHISFSDPSQILHCINHMEAKGYFLPYEPPDDTFNYP